MINLFYIFSFKQMWKEYKVKYDWEFTSERRRSNLKLMPINWEILDCITFLKWGWNLKREPSMAITTSWGEFSCLNFFLSSESSPCSPSFWAELWLQHLPSYLHVGKLPRRHTWGVSNVITQVFNEHCSSWHCNFSNDIYIFCTNSSGTPNIVCMKTIYLTLSSWCYTGVHCNFNKFKRYSVHLNVNNF